MIKLIKGMYYRCRINRRLRELTPKPEIVKHDSIDEILELM